MTAQKNKHGLLAIKELENILDTCKLDLNPVDEVWPNLYIGNVAIAQNRNALKKMGITHVLNAAHSKQGSIGDQSYYGSTIVYYGIPAEDSSSFDLSVYFKLASDFIHKALRKKNDLEELFVSREVYNYTPFKKRNSLQRHICGLAVDNVPDQGEKSRQSENEGKKRATGCKMVAARDKPMLYSMGITHIVNAASGPPHVNTGPRFYRDMDIDYFGVEADDSSDFIISVFFYPTARFIRAALSKNGRVFVHCLMGVSRSATLVLAFLMICEDLTLMEAIKAVRQHRDICPNPGFLNQLRHLDMSLVRERKKKLEAYKLKAPKDKPLASQMQAVYETPSISDLQCLLLTNRQPFGPVSLIWPGLYIGDESAARDKGLLADLGITHIVNCADGPHRINTGAQFYSDMSISYCGVEASDHPQFDLSQYFCSTASFIKAALTQNGKSDFLDLFLTNFVSDCIEIKISRAKE
ncbi:dual specificity phosphatase 13 isoform B-like protein [Labeo rohita]|uniref:Dual specificity phosphatase 13 isoform B-like protein n=1 Tax=Labeo rohita TaxID=84645 RepID=A0A498N0M3_LABRO|nr:dual specificity phosphatase 13 isoform B-like protein [Labeo rohita]RXN27819.1 dual specificity phosphatase 13 isoform B-like protein [Labeo rohita]